MTLRAQQICWRSLEHHPFESAWCLCEKFCRWNSARFGDLWPLIAKDTEAGPPPRLCYMRDVPWLDRTKFGTVFGLTSDEVRDAFFERYAPGDCLRNYSAAPNSLRVCPQCIGQGFHTHFQDLLFIGYCPIHAVPLLNACPRCRQHISSDVARGQRRDPFTCRCGYVFWNSDRSQPFSVSELALLREAVEWLDRVGGRIDKVYDRQVWSSRFAPRNGFFAALLHCIRRVGQKPPAFLAVDLTEEDP